MTNERDVLARVGAANPLPDTQLISKAQLADLDTAIAAGRAAGDRTSELVRTPPPQRWWVRPAIALGAATMLTAAVLGVVSVATRESANDFTAPPTMVAGPAQRDWSPLLATSSAVALPPPARCVRNPDEPGDPDQPRPSNGWAGSLTAAFDSHRGEIIYVDGRRETWAFDVCANSWSQLEPVGSPMENPSGGLVYDADDDVTIALGHNLAIYSAADNAWTYPDADDPTGPGDPFGAVYDPVSGLVITTIYPQGAGPDGRLEAWAYDVASNAWSRLGTVGVAGEDDPWRYDLVGYLPDLDRLVFTPNSDQELDHTLLIDPRSGERTMVWTPTPVFSLAWFRTQYGVSPDTVYAAGVDLEGLTPGDRSDDVICGFDSATLTWGKCLTGPARTIFGAFTWFGGIVGDPINERLVLIGGVFGEFGAMATDDVWAIDYGTGELIELLTGQP